MKFRRTGRLLATLIVSLAATMALTSCGTDHTAGFLFISLANINNQGGGGVNIFRIEHDFGKLTLVNPSPVSSNGSNAVQVAVTGDGRFLYVVNQGSPQASSQSVELFSVGATGVVTAQQGYATSGTSPIDEVISGSFVYVLDQIAPVGAPCPNGGTQTAVTAASLATSLCGDITAFAIDSQTGRLSLVQNQNLPDPVTGTLLTYFPVGKTPIKIVAAGATTGGFIFTLDQGDGTIFPYLIAANGQLNLTQNGPLNTGAILLSTFATDGGTHLYVADAGANQILPYVVGAGGSLSLENGGAVANQAGTAFPDTILVDNSRKFLYVGNRGANPNTNMPNSSITAFTIDPSNSRLQPIQGIFPSDSGISCMIEDPSGQFLYASNFDNSSVRGARIQSTGELQDLKKGTTFQINGSPTCLTKSGRTS